MEDPFAALLKSLQSLFHLEAMRNGKYSYTPIQNLKDATQNYNPKVKSTFIDLLRGIRESLPYLEKWRVDINSIRIQMDKLANKQGMPTIDWNKILKHPKVSPKFQFSALNHTTEIELIPWISSKVGKPFDKLNPFEMTEILINLREHHGFSQKLSAHLKKNPDFIFALIMESERNFIKISNTRLILHLTDSQIAHAIIKHTPKIISAHTNPLVQVEQFVHKLNSILSNGRSVTTLLRNSEAKDILVSSSLFQTYQTDEYKNRHDHPTQKTTP